MTSSWYTILSSRHDLKERRDQHPFRGACRLANSPLSRALLSPGLRLIQKAVMAPFGFMTFQLCLCYEYRTELERHHEHDAS
jgi:hypothetical protein